MLIMVSIEYKIVESLYCVSETNRMLCVNPTSIFFFFKSTIKERKKKKSGNSQVLKDAKWSSGKEGLNTLKSIFTYQLELGLYVRTKIRI